jgi:hypothetical protein
MKLLGRWNWYLPRWLEWLPRLNVEPQLPEASMPPPAVPRAADASAGAAEPSTLSSARRSPRHPAATTPVLEQE